jgi:hypothetical protein
MVNEIVELMIELLALELFVVVFQEVVLVELIVRGGEVIVLEGVPGTKGGGR